MSGYFLWNLAPVVLYDESFESTMNAFQPSRPPLETPEPRKSRRVRPRRRSRPYKALALETTAKLAVNLTFSAAAIGALVQLLPYHLSVQAKLQEVREETKQTQVRVLRLQNDFNKSFDPQQAKTIMQQESYRVDPLRRPVVLPDKANPDSDGD